MRRRLTAGAVLAAAALLASVMGAGTGTAAADSPALGTGYGVHDGQVPLTTTKTISSYLLQDPTRGNTVTVDGRTNTILTDADNIWGNGLPTNLQSAGVDAQFAAVSVWDYFKYSFNRLGVRNDGKGVRSVVHYGSHYTNVFWSDACGCVNYGDGSDNAHPLTTIDIGAHEITHGITSATAGLTYSGEAGALNESTSDIFATMVEFSANIPADVPDYLIGEKANLNGNGTPLRYMDRPSRDGVSPDYWSTSVPNLDPHVASGIGNHFFFLLAEGSGPRVINGISYNSPTVNGSVLTGIGQNTAAAIWYRALTVYMTSTTNYHAARTATLAAARDLYGAASSQYAAVGAAWTAVNVVGRAVPSPAHDGTARTGHVGEVRTG
ncbi:M4 family metallopeptidase [Streptomyces sp. SID13666]|uniref:M4 family metallopeptidase n=1 Tax=Streptomyces TaxID=1883 RepID=UPI001105E68F|nr:MULTISPECIES: M4 family metallopeptidase [Streptomyces]MCZ4101168.1 M4 family metallopeptidase [Streptomyces sp. H39-C1]NEA58605.1 M4 family metallopeptidase [Streptomyces sp. SID13666]NEA74761.1 M4 family metallopeptidase [Streptomyces sp. SID13588]QNA71785.1 M4 family metallopeptidase [Streptomyces sp. So13.3]